LVMNREGPFEADGAVVANDDFRISHGA
jgi:hypothetical protein